MKSPPVLYLPGDELENMRPNVYRNIAKQLNISVTMEAVVSDAFLYVATEILSLGRLLIFIYLFN